MFRYPSLCQLFYVGIRRKYTSKSLTFRQLFHVGICRIHTRKILTSHKSQPTTMARLPGGIGTKGSAQARLFHPIQHICEKWPNNHRTKRVLEVLLVGKGTHRVNRKDQLCYKCRIPEIDNGTVFHIFCCNFKIEEAPSTPFEDEIVVRAVVAAPQDLERE